MKAIIFDEFGGPDVLHEADVEIPHPGPGQVRVRVKAAGLNALDGKKRAGMVEAVFPTTFPAIPGAEVAGVVDALGEGVSDVQVGDEVLGWADTGSYAEYALATAVARKPANLSWEVAAALPVASETAERVLDELGVTAGETVLMHGASGAVGTVAVQLAIARGARVIATAGTSNQDYLTSLGATPTTYGEGLVERVRALAPDGVDAVSTWQARAPCPTPSPCAAVPSASSPSPTSVRANWASPSPPAAGTTPSSAWPPWLRTPRPER
ncbi:NADP-dependent oxidoreductase [Nocardioides luteus]|uniref:NADP-dependent oxidoreductase n=1 Tax=Nocardioides luteus TaxID=1844 RepID=UPI001A30BFA6|nr:NADP-dependent oxidoreductase [Nocardioides luteus]MBG6094495.1 NADPH:quinone reductase-like Zn-dependent oxidoreductase [Nocardioides luteus]